MRKALLMALLVPVLAHAGGGVTTGGPRARNLLGVGIFGECAMASVHFERLLPGGESFFGVARLGLGFQKEFCIGGCDGPSFAIVSPYLGGNIGEGSHFLEFGMGVAGVLGGSTADRAIAYPLLGYRYHPRDPGRFVFRVFANVPVAGAEPGKSALHFETDELLVPLLGVSLGVTF